MARRNSLSIIRALRADGAVEIELDGIKVRFAGPKQEPAPAPKRAPPRDDSATLRAMMVAAGQSDSTLDELAATLGRGS